MFHDHHRVPRMPPRQYSYRHDRILAIGFGLALAWIAFVLALGMWLFWTHAR